MIGRSNHVFIKALALEHLCANIDIIVFVKTIDGEFIQVSNSYTKHFTAEEPLDFLNKVLWDEECLKEWTENDQRVFKTKKTHIFEERVPTIIGEPISESNPAKWFLVKKIPLINEADEVVGLTAIATELWT